MPSSSVSVYSPVNALGGPCCVTSYCIGVSRRRSSASSFWYGRSCRRNRGTCGVLLIGRSIRAGRPGRAAHFERPGVGRQRRVRFMLRLFVERAAQDLREPLDLRKSFSFARRIATSARWLRNTYFGFTRFIAAARVVACFLGQPRAVEVRPRIERVAVDEQVAHGRVAARVVLRDLREPAERQREIRVAHASSRAACWRARHRSRVRAAAELRAHRTFERGAETVRERREHGLRVLHRTLGARIVVGDAVLQADQRQQRLREAIAVPVRDARLHPVCIAAARIRVVADVVRVERVDEAERAVVDRHAEDRHVVGVHHAVAEPDGLPLRDEVGRAQRRGFEQREVRIVDVAAIRIEAVDHVIGELAQQVGDRSRSARSGRSARSSPTRA